jgi:predicted acyl esterase
LYVSTVTFQETREPKMATHLKDIDIQQGPVLPPESPTVRYDGFNPRTTILTAGLLKSPARRPFRVATIREKDIEIPLRDNTVIRADVFRPAGLEDKSAGTTNVKSLRQEWQRYAMTVAESWTLLLNVFLRLPLI